MIWIKHREQAEGWIVGHKGLNGGTNPWSYYMLLASDGIEGQASTIWNDTNPSSTMFTLGEYGGVNDNNDEHIALLFASVDGISKVGYYAGTSSAQTITTGFQPKFVIIKCINNSSNAWVVLDTTRGWGSGNDNYLQLNSSAAQGSYQLGAPTSTGFTVEGSEWVNTSPRNYIYYAHA